MRCRTVIGILQQCRACFLIRDDFRIFSAAKNDLAAMVYPYYQRCQSKDDENNQIPVIEWGSFNIHIIGTGMAGFICGFVAICSLIVVDRTISTGSHNFVFRYRTGRSSDDLHILLWFAFVLWFCVILWGIFMFFVFVRLRIIFRIICIGYIGTVDYFNIRSGNVNCTAFIVACYVFKSDIFFIYLCNIFYF